jgi:hypothetical protein
MANVVRKDINRPVSLWHEKELFNGTENCLTIILRTKGCYWDRCLMCGYLRDADRRVEIENLKNQRDFALSRYDMDFGILKIFTSGSFFDEREIPEKFREYVYENMLNSGFRKLIVESRPEFIKKEKISFPSNLTLEVGIGLETANDFIREYCINKGFKFENYVNAVSVLKEEKAGVKTYLLLKPPFLSEREAIEDMIDSARAIADYTDVVSLNLMNIPSGTYLERLWKWKLYRPPWLWSAVKVLKEIRQIGLEVISDPIAAGKKRGPHNCGKCDESVAESIKNFSLSQNIEEFDGLRCDCIHLWRKVLELEDFSRIPLVR